MNYIYDILVNFNENLYDFYEWNTSDNIVHIRKMPLFKVKSEELLDIKNNSFALNNEMLEKIINKTEIFSNKGNNYIKYSCLFSDGMSAIGIMFNNKGESILKTRMLIDEEIEVIEVCERLLLSKIPYTILNMQEKDEFKTRKDKEIEIYLNNKLNELNKKNRDKLKYLYYECFNKKIDDEDKMIKEIKKELQNNWFIFSRKLVDFFKLSKVDKQCL